MLSSTPPRTALSFAALIDAAKAGGAQALENLYVDYQPQLLRYLRGQALDIADDVASETWIAVARGLGGFEGDADDFRAWLFTVARHRLIDERRRDARRPVTAPLDDTALIPALRSDPETIVMDSVAGDIAAQRIVALLPADQAEVILLRVVGDLSVDRVAQIVGKKAGTVRVLQSRGLKRLAERMSEKT